MLNFLKNTAKVPLIENRIVSFKGFLTSLAVAYLIDCGSSFSFLKKRKRIHVPSKSIKRKFIQHIKVLSFLLKFYFP